MDDLVRPDRNDVFLDKELDAVGDRLEQPEGPHAVRPVTILDAPENLALEHRDEGEERHENAKNAGNVDQAGSDRLQPFRRTGKEREKPLLQRKKNLIDRAAHPP